MSYIEKYKVVWLMPMRACTRSSVSLLKHCDSFVNRGHELLIPEDKLDYTLVFNIRNPLPRIVSIYWLSCLHNQNFYKNFEEWLYEHEYWEEDYQLHLPLYLEVLPKKPDYFVRTEFYNEDLMNIKPLKEYFISLGDEYHYRVIENQYINEFKDKTDKIRLPWYTEYNQKTADFVYDICKPQFEMFGYNKNYWKDGTP